MTIDSPYDHRLVQRIRAMRASLIKEARDVPATSVRHFLSDILGYDVSLFQETGSHSPFDFLIRLPDGFQIGVLIKRHIADHLDNLPAHPLLLEAQKTLDPDLGRGAIIATDGITYILFNAKSLFHASLLDPDQLQQFLWLSSRWVRTSPVVVTMGDDELNGIRIEILVTGASDVEAAAEAMAELFRGLDLLHLSLGGAGLTVSNPTIGTGSAVGLGVHV